jgi:Isoprenylcysteine carboxyl methyltransferase (ICMT) family
MLPAINEDCGRPSWMLFLFRQRLADLGLSQTEAAKLLGQSRWMNLGDSHVHNYPPRSNAAPRHRPAMGGIYRYVRHPMYSAFLWALEQMLLLPFPIMLLITLL